MDAGATRGAGGVEGIVWGAAEVMDAARGGGGMAEVSEAGDKGATQGQAVGPPGFTV
jgi:hypothetical protein